MQNKPSTHTAERMDPSRVTPGRVHNAVTSSRRVDIRITIQISLLACERCMLIRFPTFLFVIANPAACLVKQDFPTGLLGWRVEARVTLH